MLELKSSTSKFTTKMIKSDKSYNNITAGTPNPFSLNLPGNDIHNKNGDKLEMIWNYEGNYEVNEEQIGR